MDSNQKYKLAQIKQHKHGLSHNKSSISLTDILNSETCQRVISECREFREGIYTPLKTLFIFIKQVLSPDKSCRNAVAEVVAEHLITNRKSVSTNTGPYCKARKRLPESTVHELVKEVGKSSSKKAIHSWKAFGRELKAVDGTTVVMPDTKENQAVFPQQTVQKEGLGFPIARMVIVISLTVGTVLDYAFGAFKGKGNGELTLLRGIFDCVEQDDILLGDRCYPSFFLMADILAKGADGIFRGNPHRFYDFRKGESLGKKDHIVEWQRPKKSQLIDQQTYDAYPEKIRVREFRVNGIVYVTTLLNERKYHCKELASIYKKRWQVEISLKNIKETMVMDMASCKTPEMVKKEIGIHFLAYNFIRTIMAEACLHQNISPNQISFKGTIQLLNKFMPYFISSNKKINALMYAELLIKIVTNKIGNRPGRVEPRAVKRRPKPYDMLTRPRHVEKSWLVGKIERRTLRYASS